MALWHRTSAAASYRPQRTAEEIPSSTSDKIHAYSLFSRSSVLPDQHANRLIVLIENGGCVSVGDRPLINVVFFIGKLDLQGRQASDEDLRRKLL